MQAQLIEKKGHSVRLGVFPPKRPPQIASARQYRGRRRSARSPPSTSDPAFLSRHPFSFRLNRPERTTGRPSRQRHPRLNRAGCPGRRNRALSPPSGRSGRSGQPRAKPRSLSGKEVSAPTIETSGFMRGAWRPFRSGHRRRPSLGRFPRVAARRNSRTKPRARNSLQPAARARERRTSICDQNLPRVVRHQLSAFETLP